MICNSSIIDVINCTQPVHWLDAYAYDSTVLAAYYKIFPKSFLCRGSLRMALNDNLEWIAHH